MTTTQTETAQKIISLAAHHVSNPRPGIMLSSAELMLKDARESLTEGKPEIAIKCAVRSLAYTVGILHADYQAAAASTLTGV